MDPATSDATINPRLPTNWGVHTAAKRGAPPKNDGAEDAIAAHHTAAATSMRSIPIVTAVARAPSARSTGRGRVTRRAVAMAAVVHNATVTAVRPAQTRKSAA